MDFDILIRNGEVIDGTGAHGYSADVGLKNGKVDHIGDLTDCTCLHEIDATGMVVCPGFIDAHNHAHVDVEKGIFHEDNLLRQGITTLMAGNCGQSGWPVGEHLDLVDENGMKQNYAMLVGHHTARRELFGRENQERILNALELQALQDAAVEGIEEGAFGVTVGYANPWESLDEVMEFARAAGKTDTVYASHIRSESTHLLTSIGEILEVAQHAECAVQISHLKTFNRSAWDKLDTVFAMIDRAVDRGLAVRADRYPYTGWHGGSTNALPPVAYRIKSERGEWDSLYDDDVEPIIREHLQRMWDDRGGADTLLFCSKGEPRPEVEGKTPADLAKQWDCDLLEVGIRLEKMGGISAIGLTMSEDNLRRILSHPLVGIGTDGHLEADKRVQTHPRNYGTYPRVLGKYVREEQIMQLPEAIWKMTGMIAEHFGITDRGTLEEGLVADVVVFHPDTVRDTAEFRDAHQYPEGLPYVIVNGKLAVKGGETQPDNHGRALRSHQM